MHVEVGPHLTKNNERQRRWGGGEETGRGDDTGAILTYFSNGMPSEVRCTGRQVYTSFLDLNMFHGGRYTNAVSFVVGNNHDVMHAWPGGKNAKRVLVK